MNAGLVLGIILIYFGLLLFISFLTSKKANNKSFFLGDKKSPWFVVAFGMIGASLSGVTFISVPGWVGASSFYYMQMVLGYVLGYIVVAYVLVPIYYKMNLTSIYTYLDSRFDMYSYKTGAALFLASRVVGASFRLYLVANVLHMSIFSNWHVPFWVTVVVTIMFIWLYTFKGGIKTIIWTDTLQTVFLLASATLTVIFIGKEMNLDFSGIIESVSQSEYSRIWNFSDWKSDNHFFKQFISGAFIVITMTGLDQDMMQKNLSCKNIKDAKKNLLSLSIGLIPVNFLFLSLGVLLFMYASQMNIAIPEQTDNLFPLIALGHLPKVVGVLFIIGLIAAAYSSADSALTALTTSFTIDILGANKKDEENLKSTRKFVHVGISLLLLMVILIFHQITNESVISSLFTVAGYTYGPLLGLYTFGIFTAWKVRGKLVPYISIASPIICYFLNRYSEQLFNGYQIGFELLIINGAITFFMLMLSRVKE